MCFLIFVFLIICNDSLENCKNFETHCILNKQLMISEEDSVISVILNQVNMFDIIHINTSFMTADYCTHS